MEISDNKIQLFIRIARKIAINLPNEKDRIKAIKWIKKIDNTKEKSAKRTKFHVLQLLLYCLQRKLLVGPFENIPEEGKKLQQHNWAYQPSDIAKYILEYEFNKIGKPPVTVEISGDLNEFVSFQEIPSFGAHFFYAYSPEEIRKWDNLDKSIVPRGYLNLTILSSPDTSILAKTIHKSFEERQKKYKKVKKHAAKLEKHQKDFHDITIIDENAAELKEAFTDHLPVAKEAVKTDTLKEAMDAGIVRREDIEVDPEIAKEAAQTERAHVEEITVIKDGKRCVKKKKVKKSGAGKDAQKIEDQIKELEEKRDAERKAAMEKMPAKLRERLSQKYTRPESERPITTPEIFNKTVGKKSLRRKRIYKPEEFGLTKDEKFVPAEEFVKGLKYKEPEIKIRRSPIPRDMQGFYRRSLPLGSLGTGKRQIIEQQADREDEESPVSKKVRLSFESSWEKIQKSRIPDQLDESRQVTPKKRFLDRLKALKAAKPIQLEFDDIEVDVTPEEVSFERFVYQELPESEAADESVGLLKEDEMRTEDVFGEEAIADVSVLPKSVPIEMLEQAEILLEHEMQTDDLLTSDKVADPRVVFKEVTVEGERYDSVGDRATPEQRSIRIGRRVLHIPGERPTIQTFVEQTDEPLHPTERDTSALSESVISKIMDLKLKALGYEHSPPRQYGPWATRLRRQIERLERGEQSIESAEDSDILKEDEMELDDVFEPGTPEIVQEQRRQKLAEQTSRIKELRRKWADHIAQRKAAPPPLESDIDLLDPLIFHQPIYEPKRLLDISLSSEEAEKLPSPLVKRLDIRRRHELEEYEEQLDKSLSLLYGSGDMPPVSHEKGETRVFYDPDFLERTIYEAGPDKSIISESEMEEDVFGEPIDKLPSFSPPPPPKRSKPKKSVHFSPRPPKRTIEDLLPREQLDEISMPEDEIAMAATLIESESSGIPAFGTEPTVSFELEKLTKEHPESPDLKRIREEYLRQTEKIQELKRRYQRQKELQKAKPRVLGKKGAKIYRGPLGSPGIPGKPGPSGLGRVQWESFVEAAETRTPSPVSKARRRQLEMEFEQEIDRQILQHRIDAFGTPGDSLIEDIETQDLFPEDEVMRPTPVRQIPMPPVETSTAQRISPTRRSPYQDRVPREPVEQRVPMERIEDQSYPSGFLETSMTQRTSPTRRSPYQDRIPREPVEQRVPMERIEHQSYPSGFLETSMTQRTSPTRRSPYQDRVPRVPVEQRVPMERIEDQSHPSGFLETSMTQRTSPTRRSPYQDRVPVERIEDQSYPSGFLETSMTQRTSPTRRSPYQDRVPVERIEDQSYPSGFLDVIEDEVTEERLEDISSGILSDLEAIESYTGPDSYPPVLIPEDRAVERDETPSVLAKSIQQTKKLQDFRRKYRQMRGLPLLPEEQIKDAVQDYHERQRIIENMGLMDQGIQETLTQKPLIAEPEIIKPLNVIEAYERDMEFIEKARRMHRQFKDISSEAKQIAERIEQDAILAQQKEDELIEDMEDLDLEVEEPPPLSKLPMHPSEIPVEFDIEQVSFPEGEISFESDEEESPVYTREQFDREFEEEQRQRKEEEMLAVAEEPRREFTTTLATDVLNVDDAGMQTVESNVIQMRETFRRNLERLRRIRQLRRAYRHRIDLSPIKEVSEEKDEDEFEREDDMFDDSYKADPFASFEANIDYYIIQDIGERVDSHAPPLTAEEMISFDEEDVEEPPPVSAIPMPPPTPPMPAEQYFEQMKEALAYEDDLEGVGQPEEMEILDEFYGITDEYGMPLSPTRKTLARNIRQSMVTSDLIQRYRLMKNIPHKPQPIDLPYAQQYLKYSQGQLGPSDFPDAEKDIMDESFPGEEFTPLSLDLSETYPEIIEDYGEPSILGENELSTTFGETATPPRMKDIPMPALSSRSPPRQFRQIDRLPEERLSEQEFPGYESFSKPESTAERISDQELFYESILDRTPIDDHESRRQEMIHLPEERLAEQEFPGYEPFLEPGSTEERISDQDLLYESILDQTPIDDIFQKLDKAAALGEEDIYEGEYSGFESSLERTPAQKPIQGDLLEPTDFVQYPDERGILDEPILSDELASPLIKSPARPDYLQFDDSIGSPDQFEDYQIKKQFGIDPRQLPKESLVSLSPPFHMETSPRPQQRRQPSPRRHSTPSRMEPMRPRRLFEDSSVSRAPLTLEEKFDLISSRTPLPSRSLQMSPRERIRELIARQPKFEMIPVRRDEYAPLEFITRPISEEEQFIEAEEFPYDHLPYDAEDIEFGDLYHALYIPTEEEEREIQEFQARRQTSPVPVTPREFSRRTHVDSPIGKTWISPGEEGFKWLDNYVPSQAFEDRMEERRKGPRRVTFAPELQFVTSFDPTLAPSQLRFSHGPPRVARLPHPRLSRQSEPPPLPSGNVLRGVPRVATLRNPRLTRQPEPPSTPTTKNVLRGMPRVASLRNPRLTRQPEPPSTPATKNILRGTPRVASLRNPRLARQSEPPPRLSTSRLRLFKQPRTPRHSSVTFKKSSKPVPPSRRQISEASQEIPQPPRKRIAGSLTPVPVRRPSRPLLPHELPRAAEIIRSAEAGAGGAASRVEIIRTSEPGKETVRTNAEHIRPIQQESSALPRPHDYISQPSTSKQSTLPVAGKRITQSLTTAAVGENKSVAKKSSLALEQESVSNTKTLTRQNVITTRDPSKVRTSVSKISIKKGSNVGRKPLGPSNR